MNESCHIYECVTSQVRTSCVSHQYERLTYLWGMSQMLMRCAAFMKGRVTYMRVMSPQVKAYAWVISPVWTWHVTHMNMKRELCCASEQVVSRACVSCLTYKHMSHDATRVNESRHTYECVTSHVSTGLPYVTHINASCHTYEYGMAHICKRKATRMHKSCHAYECVTSHM